VTRPAIDPRSVLALRRQLYRRSFVDFARGLWHAAEPTRALMPSVAFDAVCAGLQSVADGRIKRLAVEQPPGTSKSITGAVLFPSWLLLRSGGKARVMCGSYSHDLAVRDSRRCRDVVTSPAYRTLVDGAWQLRDDANTLGDWHTTVGGRRLVTSTGSKALGERATIQILDDVLSGADVHSPAKRKEALRWMSEVLPSRLEDQEHDARVLFGQRLHPEDPLSLAHEQGWRILSLPALLGESDAPCELYDDAGALVWRDPREPGEPLLALLGEAALDRLKLELGSTSFVAQYMQRPSDDSGAQIKRSWWSFYRPPHVAAASPRPAGCDAERPAVSEPAHYERTVIAMDATFGSLTGDYAVIVCWSAIGGATTPPVADSQPSGRS